MAAKAYGVRIAMAMVLGEALSAAAGAAEPARWSRVYEKNALYSLVEGSKLYAFVAQDRRMIVSLDQGAHWSAASPVIREGVYPASVVRKGPDFYAADFDAGIFRVADGETAWKAVGAGFFVGNNVRTLAVTPALVLAGTSHGLYATRDRGETWTSLNDTIPDTYHVNRISVSGSTLFLDVNNGYSYRGTPKGGGYDWMLSLLKTPKAVVSKDRFLLAASAKYEYPDRSLGVIQVNRSEDDGITWSPSDSGLPPSNRLQVVDLDRIGDFLFAGNSNFLYRDDSANVAVYRSEDDGKSWIPFSDGLPKNQVLGSLSACGGTLFAAMWDAIAGEGGIWALSVPPTGIGDAQKRPSAEAKRERNPSVTGILRVPEGGRADAGDYRANGSRIPAPRAVPIPLNPR
jgi:hypothetical protein